MNENNESLDKADDHDVIYALRTIHQSQTQLVILADQKANILIGVIAIKFTIVFTKSNLPDTSNNIALIAFTIFILCETCSILLALLVILPKNININNSKDLQSQSNPLFFGTFTNYFENKYVEFLTNKMANNQSARKLLSTDIYQVGCVFKKTYTFLKYAYSFSIFGVLSSFLLIYKNNFQKINIFIITGIKLNLKSTIIFGSLFYYNVIYRLT